MATRGPDRSLQILFAASELLAERGSPSAVSLQDVAARAGITKVTLYRYFPSKDTLFAEVAASFTDGSELVGRRDQIVDAAMRVIPRYGLHGVTMERIADEAGVSPATLYWHFKNKNELLLALVERMIGQIDFASLLPSDPVEDADALMQAVVPRLFALLNERFSLMPIVMTEMMTHPELAPVIYEQVVSKIWATATVFMNGQVEAGTFRPGHPLLRIYALAGMILMYSLARRNFGAWVDLPPPELAASEFADLFLHGVIARDSGGATHD